jgi:hypothetical protein
MASESESQPPRRGGARPGSGQPPHAPTAYQRERVKLLSSNGVRHEDIALVIGIDDKTLRKHYRTELDMGKAEANIEVLGYLFSAATDPTSKSHSAAMIFWAKTQCGFRETGRLEVTVGNAEDAALAAERLAAQIASAPSAASAATLYRQLMLSEVVPPPEEQH